MAADYERVALDTTMVFTGFFDKLAPFPAGDLPLARELGMAGKILLGSDFPNLPYPYARQLAGLAGIGPRRRLAAQGVLGQPGGHVRASAEAVGGGSSAATRSRGRAGVRWPSRPVMSSLAISALATASSVAWTTAL